MSLNEFLPYITSVFQVVYFVFWSSFSARSKWIWYVHISKLNDTEWEISDEEMVKYQHGRTAAIIIISNDFTPFLLNSSYKKPEKERDTFMVRETGPMTT